MRASGAPPLLQQLARVRTHTHSRTHAHSPPPFAHAGARGAPEAGGGGALAPGVREARHGAHRAALVPQGGACGVCMHTQSPPLCTGLHTTRAVCCPPTLQNDEYIRGKHEAAKQARKDETEAVKKSEVRVCDHSSTGSRVCTRRGRYAALRSQLILARARTAQRYQVDRVTPCSTAARVCRWRRRSRSSSARRTSRGAPRTCASAWTRCPRCTARR